MLQPKKQKHRKQFRGVWRRLAVKGMDLNFGSYGLKAMDKGWITDRQLEATRVAMARATRKAGKFWIRIFPDKPYTKKPPEVGMGSGKGEVSHFVAPVSPGRMLLELDGLDKEAARRALRIVASKLPIRTSVIHKGDVI